ncbi:MAG: hypothetical protein WKG01_11145 [Kofleriaceae bacterium]
MRAIRELAMVKTPLVLCGDGNLATLARQLHRETLGYERPFVISDPRRTSTHATPRAPENHGTGLDAMRVAAGGTVCIWASRLPPDFAAMTDRLHTPGNTVRLIVCSHALHGLSSVTSTPIRIPALTEREHELPRIVSEYAADSIAALGVDATNFTARDAAWIIDRHPGSLPAIETATDRLVAIRAFGGVTRAATRLGITHAALSRWIGRRRLPF